ncbi:hypothetical protein V3C99_000235, partial [Haemonchus contortus]
TAKLKMFICSFTVLFLALHISCGLKIRGDIVPGRCGRGTQFMLYRAHRAFLEAHNSRRASLAEGKLLTKAGGKWPAAGNMRFMAYNCTMEEEAAKLTKTCERFTGVTGFNQADRNFAAFDSNNDNGGISVAEQAASLWWNQMPHWQNLQNITENDSSAIPFFLMAQAEIDKFGCSVTLCNKDGNSYYTVACIYGQKVKVGTELYREGPACSTCKDNCYKHVLCK